MATTLTYDLAVKKFKKHAEMLESNFVALGRDIDAFLKNARKKIEKQERRKESKKLKKLERELE